MSELQGSLASGYGRFLRSWLDAPFSVGAVAPSGRALAKMMTRELKPGDRVVELGPGTGTFTRQILARGVAQKDLFLVERCPGFADLLERSFPFATVLRGDATVRQEGLLPHRGTIDFIISGLPLILLSREQKHRVLHQAFRLLKPSGAFYQFTYGGRCPIERRQLARSGLESRCAGFIALNIPPAFIYRISKTELAP